MLEVRLVTYEGVTCHFVRLNVDVIAVIGAVTGSLPIRAVLKHELLINLQTARSIGVTIPDVLIKRADRVVQ
jgi:putative ABC transport system substrate-binding protein